MITYTLIPDNSNSTVQLDILEYGKLI